MKLHQIQAIGRIGNDAKMIHLPNGEFMSFSLAVDDSYTNGQGQKVERTLWYDCTSNQERFYKIMNWLTSGREVMAIGKPSHYIYNNKNANNAPTIGLRISLQDVVLGSSPHDQRTTNG